MAKAPKGSSSTSTTAKAGKKHGSYQEPPAPNLEKRARSEAGRQQFLSPHPLTVKKAKIVYNKKTFQFETKLVDVNVPFIYDETRKQFVYSPLRESKED